VLVGQAKLRQDIPDCVLILASCLRSHIGLDILGGVHQSMIHMLFE